MAAAYVEMGGREEEALAAGHMAMAMLVVAGKREALGSWVEGSVVATVAVPVL